MALISHRYKFIFIKTKKTAGTATEVTLSQLMDKDDIVTPIFPLEPGHEARNFTGPSGEFYNHMPATEIRSLLGPETFDSYFKFCVEREPLDKCLSHFAMTKFSPHHNAKTANLTWGKYVARGNFPNDFSQYTDESGQALVDRIINYKYLTEDLTHILSRQGMPFFGLTSKAKSGFRSNSKKMEAVTNEQKQVIYSAFERTSIFLKENFNSDQRFSLWPDANPTRGKF